MTTRFDDPVRDIGLGPENLKIIASLPEASRVAYNRTLFGRNTHANFVFALDEEDFSEAGGCTRKAVAKVFTPDQVKGTFLNPKDVLVDSDKRFVSPTCGSWPAAELRALYSTTPMAPQGTSSLFVALERATSASNSAPASFRTCLR